MTCITYCSGTSETRSEYYVGCLVNQKLNNKRITYKQLLDLHQHDCHTSVSLWVETGVMDMKVEKKLTSCIA